jgi:hypothetical protein
MFAVAFFRSVNVFIGTVPRVMKHYFRDFSAEKKPLKWAATFRSILDLSAAAQPLNDDIWHIYTIMQAYVSTI